MASLALAMLAPGALSLVAARPGPRRLSVPRAAAAVAEAVAEAPPSLLRERLDGAILVDGGSGVEVKFADGAAFLFHALWLRDACRDSSHVAAAAGERILTATPVGPAGERVDPVALRAVAVEATEMSLSLRWSGADSPITESVLDAAALRLYAPAVARALHVPAGDAAHGEWPDWLAPYTGFPGALAAESYVSYYGDARAEGAAPFPRTFEYEALMAGGSAAEQLELIRTTLECGAAMVTGVPDEESGVALRRFVSAALGGLQKDPTRDEPNWRIVKKANAASISYDHDKRLYQHTDSSVPPHGLPALVLTMHYVEGAGANTLTDGFAVADQLRQEDPEAFDLLAQYGYDGERDFAGSRVDSPQRHDHGLVVRRRHPIFSVDQRGKLTQVTYNEVFRMPMTLPYDVFPKWYVAFSRFVELLHSPDFERTIPMEAGNLLVMNNWRTLHGRAGGRATSNRHVVGGTVLRESVFSAAAALHAELGP
ncbi:hypothetical protein M885DRAFT_552825 [Pelagophyceae sp. CCMP2097]|nr:hypothetical protein M885DRAFT_552825 [Pelagophyceae sp. CCMP2097]